MAKKTPQAEQNQEQESKSTKFLRLATIRTQKVIACLQRLKNCSAKGNYEYTEKQVEYIFNAIEDELKKTREAFATKSDVGQKLFTLFDLEEQGEPSEPAQE